MIEQGKRQWKTTEVLLKAIHQKFKAAASGAWLTKRQLGLRQTRTLEAISSTILRRLVENKVLERSLSPDNVRKEHVYRPTHGGWEVLQHLDSFPMEQLFEKFGRPFTPEHRSCGLCGIKVSKDRKANADRCWACAPTAQRTASKMDHVPRSQQYLDNLSSEGRRGKEMARVAAAASARRKERRLEAFKANWTAQAPSKPNITPVARAEALPGLLDGVHKRLDELMVKIENVAKVVGSHDRDIDELQRARKAVEVSTNGHAKDDGMLGLVALLQKLQQAGVRL